MYLRNLPNRLNRWYCEVIAMTSAVDSLPPEANQVDSSRRSLDRTDWRDIIRDIELEKAREPSLGKAGPKGYAFNAAEYAKAGEARARGNCSTPRGLYRPYETPEGDIVHGPIWS